MLRRLARKNASPTAPATGTARIRPSNPTLPIIRSTVLVETPSRRASQIR